MGQISKYSALTKAQKKVNSSQICLKQSLISAQNEDLQEQIEHHKIQIKKEYKINQSRAQTIVKGKEICSILFQRYSTLCELLEVPPQIEKLDEDNYKELETDNKYTSQLKVKEKEIKHKESVLKSKLKKFEIWIRCQQRKFKRNKNAVKVSFKPF